MEEEDLLLLLEEEDLLLLKEEDLLLLEEEEDLLLPEEEDLIMRFQTNMDRLLLIAQFLMSIKENDSKKSFKFR